ncbi:SHOCT domain-containing protein [Beggiatoa leptomitoformis]|uniref:SHOCT domain-containing protein n=1 Tax=Beggiatoa leptomitoformis TaxID=288004 RepID=A0A2N9YDN1_9GAMM|nr:SHOCT domain-containing protein [Beggiatoa leptomitoformis]ALG69117.1 SHOCT domain-containing protein [Beggiatoa leptomitoformis]AUI68469.1 SHOCT domain-containing protein [Beggiatoa leptomitoformis]
MQALTPAAQQQVQQLSQRYGVSVDAVTTLLQALVNGNGSMAQFSHPELGGSGQWMQGGMLMLGDMFNHNLKAIVNNLCNDLNQLLYTQPFVISNTPYQGNWYPADLGMATASGSQNGLRYAYFANTRRLAVEVNGQVSVYDTLNHQIGGFSQQQGSGSSLLFSSQYGTVDVLNLPLLSGKGTLGTLFNQNQNQNVPQPIPVNNTNNNMQSQSNMPQTPLEVDIFDKIHKLADLRAKNIISEDEFASKKAELLSRL